MWSRLDVGRCHDEGMLASRDCTLAAAFSRQDIEVDEDELELLEDVFC